MTQRRWEGVERVGESLCVKMGKFGWERNRRGKEFCAKGEMSEVGRKGEVGVFKIGTKMEMCESDRKILEGAVKVVSKEEVCEALW